LVYVNDPVTIFGPLPCTLVEAGDWVIEGKLKAPQATCTRLNTTNIENNLKVLDFISASVNLSNYNAEGIITIMDWKTQIQTEFDRADQARVRGNEGQARVCARRAAGIAAREYLSRRGQSVRTPSAYDLLKLLAEDPLLSLDLRQATAYLTLRVNEEFKLPVDVDLVAEARKLCDELIKNG